MVCRWRTRFRFLEERQLFGERLQVIDLERHALQPHAPPKATNKQALQHRLQVGFPAGAARQHLMRALLVMVAVPDCEQHASAHPPLLSKCPAEVLQQSVQLA